MIGIGHDNFNFKGFLLHVYEKEGTCVCVCLMKYETAGEEVSDFFYDF